MGDWEIWARPDQLPPAQDWTTWLVMGGRGAGKTRTGAEWVKAMVFGKAPFTHQSYGRIALIGETLGDARDVMVEGVSGLLSVHSKDERPNWQPSRKRLVWPNGAIAQIFSAEDPESLRGPQFDAAWGDELAKWKHAEATWDMLQFGLRLGVQPRQIVTTTPRPTALLKRLLKEPRTVTTHAPTRANLANLAPGFLDTIVRRYQGTRLGRQELDGELIEERSDALWRRQQLDLLRVEEAPVHLVRIVVAIDPPATSTKGADACGIVAAGLDGDGNCYILKDKSLSEVSPTGWATKAIALFHRLEADCVIAEVNQGGEMVTTILAGIDANVPVRSVRANRGKYLRAEPVSALYEQGRVRHVGNFAELEDEMCDFGLDGLSSGKSPDRLDAMVWAVTNLCLGEQAEPKVRSF
ncbi:DNA-packaging protein [Cohaesibacter celericrescens]|uniref:ATP-binding protein n=1 Tax=Cohaesibacter celericrescens TaxID=2067669 RepID=A0A2N5XR72_9HYPH|nr:terminase family protein [Cohaesibacter celericrescens]PLW76965.1 ATP-binding protein [Cohaesibacter celericrescens]